MGLANSLDDVGNPTLNTSFTEVNLTIDDIDDEELDAYIMSEEEFLRKDGLWHKINATYLEEQRSKFGLLILCPRFLLFFRKTVGVDKARYSYFLRDNLQQCIC